MLYAGFFGLIAGGVLGGVVSALNLGIKSAGLFGFLIITIPAVLLRIPPEAREIDENFRRFGIAFIFITTLTAIFVSYIQQRVS